MKNTRYFKELWCVFLFVLSHFCGVANAELPQDVLKYIESGASLRGASFDFVEYSAFVKDLNEIPITSEKFKSGAGHVSLDYLSPRYSIDYHIVGNGGETRRRRVVYSNGVSTRIDGSLGDSREPVASVGGNKTYFCPFNYVPTGHAFNMLLAEPPDSLRGLPEILLNGEFVGEIEANGSKFSVQSPGYKKRSAGPYALDLQVELSPSHSHLPKLIELWVTEKANPTNRYCQYRIEALNFVSRDGLHFPVEMEMTYLVGKPQSRIIRATIDPGSLTLNSTFADQEFQLDLEGYSGYDYTKKQKFGEELRPKAPLANTQFPKDAIDEKETKISNQASILQIAIPVLVVAVVILLAYVFQKRRKSTLLLVMLALSNVSLGCSTSNVQSNLGSELLVAKGELSSVVDYGRVVGISEEKSAIVTFRNVSDLDVVLDNPRSTCGCSSATWDMQTVAPGEEVKLRVAVQPPTVGAPKMVMITSVAKTKQREQIIHVPVTVKYEIDWVVEGSVIMEGCVGTKSIGDIVITVKPFTPAPKIHLVGNGLVRILGEPTQDAGEPRKWKYPVTCDVTEAGTTTCGEYKVISDEGFFPSEYRVEFLVNGKFPARWNRTLLKLQENSEGLVSLSLEPGWDFIRVDTGANNMLFEELENNDPHSDRNLQFRVLPGSHPARVFTIHAVVASMGTEIKCPLMVAVQETPSNAN